MNTRTAKLILTAVLSAATCPSYAEFIGVRCRPFVDYGWEKHGFSGLTTYRLYAIFDESEPEIDGVVSAYGLEGLPVSVQSSDGTFHNDALHDALVEPDDLRPKGIWSNQWDTFVTIGWFYGAPGDNTLVTPGFGEETNQLLTDWASEYIAWFPSPCDVNFCPGRTYGGGRILLMQLTVAQGESVSGVINFLTGSAGKIEQLPFASEPPCPADIDWTGDVDRSDLLQVLARWGPCGRCDEDLDRNGVIDMGDVLIVLVGWGDCAAAQGLRSP